MINQTKLGGISVWRRLRTRMAISYVAVTLLIVLLLESLVLGLLLYVFTRSPLPGYWALQQSGSTAEIIALKAAVHSSESGLSSTLTFEPGRDSSLALEQQEGDPPSLSWFAPGLDYVAPGSPAPAQPSVALVIGPEGQVIASSYPDRYPVSATVEQLVPADLELIRNALSGQSNGDVRESGRITVASVAYTIWDRDRQPIGAVYLQSPASILPDSSLLGDVASIVLPSSLFWLCLMLPIGAVFGILATRSLIRRIERLAGATARFKEGDASIRVPVSQADEIGQLEFQFNQMAEQLAVSFAQRQALAEQSARREERARIEQEMASARYIQQSLLPIMIPQIPGWQIHAQYHPARQIGGDFYDFLPLPDGRLGITIGDATGKGVPSALIMATTVAMLRAAAPSLESPGKVLAWVNDLLKENIPAATFATCFYAIFDPDCGRLRFANAGHNLPFLSRGGEVLELHATGMPLGLLPGLEYEESEIDLGAADILLFYTDGLVESHNPSREMYGVLRLRQRVLERSGRNGQGPALIDFLLQDMKAFTSPEIEQEDDVTLVVLNKP